VIYKIECLLLALKDSPITCRLLTNEINEVARANYARTWEGSGEDLRKVPAITARFELNLPDPDGSKESMSTHTADPRAAKYWQKVQEHIKSDSPQFVTNRKKSSLFRQSLFSLEDVMLDRCSAEAHKDMVEQCEALIERFAHKMLHMKFESDLPDLGDVTVNDQSPLSRASAPQQDYHDVTAQLRQSEEIVERAELMLGLTDTFRTLGVPARLNGVLAAVKRISDRNAILEEEEMEGASREAIQEIQELEDRVHELTVQNGRLRDQLATAEELIQSLTDHENCEHKQATPSRHLPTQMHYIARDKEVFLPFENAPLHCERSVVQAVLSFLADSYPKFEPFCSMADSCMWPTTVDKCPRGQCVGCRRHEYRVDAVNRLRGVCDALLAMKIQTQGDEEDENPKDADLGTTDVSEKERYGFVLEEEVKVWEEKLYVQWTRGPVPPPVAVPPEEKESAAVKALRDEIDMLYRMSALDRQCVEMTTSWESLNQNSDIARSIALHEEVEKLRATAKLCLLQMQRLESAVHPTNPVTYPDSQRTPETLEGVPQRLLGVIRSVSELQKENNKLKRVATGLEDKVAEIQNSLSSGEAQVAVKCADLPHVPGSDQLPPSSPTASPSKASTWKAASEPVSKALHGARQLLTSPARSRSSPTGRPSSQARTSRMQHVVARLVPVVQDDPTELQLCAEVVHELEKLLNHGTTSPSSPTRGLFTRLTCVLDGMRDLYFRDSNAEVEKLTMELEVARSNIQDMEEHCSAKNPRRSQIADLQTQLRDVAIVLGEHQYVPKGCTYDAIVQSGEIPRYMKRLGDAHTAARAAIELMLQEGVDSKATDAALNVWSTDSLDVVRTIKQALTSHLSQPKEPVPHEAAPKSPVAVPQPSLEADQKTSAPSSRLPYHRHMSRRGIINFTQNAARNNPPRLETPHHAHAQDKQHVRKMDDKGERKGEAKHVHYADAGEKEVHNMKMGADAKYFHRKDGNMSDKELDSDEERQVQRLLQEMYDEKALQAEQKSVTAVADTASTAQPSEVPQTEPSAPPQETVDKSRCCDGPAAGEEGGGEEPEPRASDVSATGSEGYVGFVLI